ncbi:hypothetical protein C1I98_06025 [Spongiactinospora gelatinilytica]|uniref:Uncharacterized protein n=1 Tax=Spongiactinospora gelatinilytica TaxID=2666298 RepID=A0A2W2GZK1_9ACTN|nr:hypothetical protein [Spongiactinospora gelatinilytica]PZG53113.1 hypothetical protein C1I98_06025 [Spongiactinospora gelatinilytica]
MSFRNTDSLHGWPAEEDDELGQLQTRHPKWRIWRGLDDRCRPTGWHGTREPDMRVDAETSRELDRLLTEQESTGEIT